MRKGQKGVIAFIILAAFGLIFVQGCSKSSESSSSSSGPKFTLKSEYVTN